MSQPRRKRRWPLVVFLALLLVVPGLLLGVGAAITFRPSWYHPSSIDYRVLEEDKRAQLRLENEISAAVNREESVTIELTETQANRWIVARDELWPGELPSLRPLQQPQVDLLGENRFRVGALVEQAGVASVVSAELEVEVTPDTVTLAWNHVNAGALRTPRSLTARIVRKASAGWRDRLPAADVEQAVQDGKITLPNDFVWPNGKRRVRITDFAIERGEIRLNLEPY